MIEKQDKDLISKGVRNVWLNGFFRNSNIAPLLLETQGVLC